MLFIIADQFRADLLSGGLAAAVPTPNLDALVARGLNLSNHHTVAVPCGPARASLFTGLYPSENGAIRNGAPLKSGLTNLAHQLRRIGREPLLFGYTDTQPDPSLLFKRDPAKRTFSGPMDGFTEVVEMREEAWRWLSHLRAIGYDVPDAEAADSKRLYRPHQGLLGGAALYQAVHSDTAFLTDETIKALDIRKANPWTAFVTYIRPHPPFVAPDPYHALIDPDTIPKPLETGSEHPFLQVERSYPSNVGMFWGYDGYAKGLDRATIALVRATYLGLVAELDSQIGRLFDWLCSTGQQSHTAIVFTADHGEMLGDFGLWGKLSPFPQASQVPFLFVGPAVPPKQISNVTESTDIMELIVGYLEGCSAAFENRPNKTARVEFSLSNPAKPTRFQDAWDIDLDNSLCTVAHDEVSRTAHFPDGIEDLYMEPHNGTPM